MKVFIFEIVYISFSLYRQSFHILIKKSHPYPKFMKISSQVFFWKLYCFGSCTKSTWNLFLCLWYEALSFIIFPYKCQWAQHLFLKRLSGNHCCIVLHHHQMPVSVQVYFSIFYPVPWVALSALELLLLLYCLSCCSFTITGRVSLLHMLSPQSIITILSYLHLHIYFRISLSQTKSPKLF